MCVSVGFVLFCCLGSWMMTHGVPSVSLPSELLDDSLVVRGDEGFGCFRSTDSAGVISGGCDSYYRGRVIGECVVFVVDSDVNVSFCVRNLRNDATDYTVWFLGGRYGTLCLNRTLGVVGGDYVFRPAGDLCVPQVVGRHGGFVSVYVHPRVCTVEGSAESTLVAPTPFSSNSSREGTWVVFCVRDEDGGDSVGAAALLDFCRSPSVRAWGIRMHGSVF